jgi:hypothetical protein
MNEYAETPLKPWQKVVMVGIMIVMVAGSAAGFYLGYIWPWPFS